MQIEIDECVYWILHTVVSSDLLKYNHVTVREENLEFIVVEAKNYCIDLSGLTKIEKITGMKLLQMKSFNGISHLWFGRKMKLVSQSQLTR
ncbi:MAG TPA: hypothetical protein VE594_05905 [Nitrososphaeraceae archaeon]|nr:hypothetical protein [Nitrososphaeraceae archaeon]